jgi:hypothetical protein
MYEVAFLTDELRRFLHTVKGVTIADALDVLRVTPPEALVLDEELDPCGVYDDVAMELDSYSDLYGKDYLLADLLDPKVPAMDEVKPFFPLPGEEATTGDRLILNALRRKLDALAEYEKNPTAETQKAYLDAVDHMNHIKENV